MKEPKLTDTAIDFDEFVSLMRMKLNKLEGFAWALTDDRQHQYIASWTADAKKLLKRLEVAADEQTNERKENV